MKKSENKKEKCIYCDFKFPKDDMINDKGKFICFICARSGKDKI